jgi:integrase
MNGKGEKNCRAGSEDGMSTGHVHTGSTGEHGRIDLGGDLSAGQTGGRTVRSELLTDKIVRNLSTPASGAKITYDGGNPTKRVSGFGVRVTAAGTRAFVLTYRIHGIQKRCTIGQFPDWDTARARDKAKELKRNIDNGRDPLLEERQARDAEQQAREAPTMPELIELWRREEKPKKRERTAQEYESLIAQWIDPEHPQKKDVLARSRTVCIDGKTKIVSLGKRKVAAITESDINQLHAAITAEGTPVRANRTIEFVRHLFTLAVRRKMRADNPAAGFERNHEEEVERYVAPYELGPLGAALAGDRNQTHANAIRLDLLTGARSDSEVFSATWTQFDLTAGIWTKPSSHTKQKKKHRVPLSPVALQLLLDMKEKAEAQAKKQKRPPSPYVFPAERREGHIVSVKSTWRRVCKAAGLENVRVHDLRHSYASFAANAGVELQVVGKLLGHTQLKTTMRYAHLFDSTLRVATGRVGAIVSATAGPQSGEIIPLPPRKPN